MSNATVQALRTLAGAAAIVAVFSTGVDILLAYCSLPTPKVCSEFFESDAVFVARVVSQRYVDDEANIRFDVRVSQTLRGAVKRDESVYTGNDSGRLLWIVGREYVVFAWRQHGRLVSGDPCGPIGDEHQNVPALLEQIHALGRRRTGSIEGRIVWTLDADGMPGVPVRVSDGTTTYATRSNRKGDFRVDVPPGVYEILPDPSVKQSDLNWESLTGVRLVAGQCSQYMFVAREPLRHRAAGGAPE